MKIIRITPGLGNQMFQYAFLLNYKLKGEKIALDISPCKHSKKHNGYELEKIFNIKEHILTKWEKFKINGPYFYIKEREITWIKLLNKIIQKIRGEKYTIHSEKYIIEKDPSNEFNFSEKYLVLKGDKYISGYFNSWKYFEGVKEKVLKTFSFPEIKESDNKNFNILTKIKNGTSISLHVRRGDYVGSGHEVCDSDYFLRAFQEILEKKKNEIDSDINIFIFSDDTSWCEKELHFLSRYKHYFIDWNKKESSYKDMQLMSECKYNIISNSTFSWWGGYLNKNINKIVIAPKYWFKGVKTSVDRCEKDWFLI